MKDLCLILSDENAELIDDAGEVIWNSNDDENFAYADDIHAAEVVTYLLRAELIDAEADIGEITDDRSEPDDDDDSDDDDDDDDDADDDDDSDDDDDD